MSRFVKLTSHDGAYTSWVNFDRVMSMTKVDGGTSVSIQPGENGASVFDQSPEQILALIDQPAALPVEVTQEMVEAAWAAYAAADLCDDMRAAIEAAAALGRKS